MDKKAKKIPDDVLEYMRAKNLPINGSHPFRPRLKKTRSGANGIQRAPVLKGPKQGKEGFLDEDGNIWIRDPAHAGLPDHWDVQINGGRGYYRVSDDGNLLA